MMERRVVITGMSAITPIGHGKDPIVQNLQNGVSFAEREAKVEAGAEHELGAYPALSYLN